MCDTQDLQWLCMTYPDALRDPETLNSDIGELCSCHPCCPHTSGFNDDKLVDQCCDSFAATLTVVDGNLLATFVVFNIVVQAPQVPRARVALINSDSELTNTF